jgi:hypothetical protein
MALSFPPNPEIGDTYVAPNGYTYTWDGTKWYVSSSGISVGGTSPITIKYGGVNINTQTTTINFVGALVTATTTANSVTIEVTATPLTTATTATLGGVKIGSGITIADGVISVREGLQYWTESKTIVDSSQTAIISLLVNGTQTNINAVIKAQGVGAVANDDGGDARGEYAVDWQRIRGNTTQVAAGNFSVIGGGSFNKSSGLHSIVLGGNNNTNNSDYSVILGGVNGNTRGINGAVIMPGFATGGAADSSGKIQAGQYLLSGDTVLTTSPATLTTDGSSNVAANNQITLSNNSAIQFKATIMAKELFATTASVVVWTVQGTARRGATNTSTAYISLPVAAIIDGNTGTSWQVSMDIESSLGCILMQVQGSADQQIRWVAKVETIEIADTGM